MAEAGKTIRKASLLLGGREKRPFFTGALLGLAPEASSSPGKNSSLCEEWVQQERGNSEWVASESGQILVV